MLNNKWFCEPDPFREKYCFFHLDTKVIGTRLNITGWKTAIGNVTGIVKKNHFSGNDEKQNIMELLPDIFLCRKKNLILITDKDDTLPLLRARIATLGIENISLASVKSISLEKLLKKNFLYIGSDNLQDWCRFLSITKNCSDETELIKTIFCKIAPLIPREEIL